MSGEPQNTGGAATPQGDGDEYRSLLKAIEKRMNPDANTVLVVDDSKVVRLTVAKSIAGIAPNAVICQAENGAEALERLEEIRLKYKNDPVLVVSDLEMPVMDGWEFIDRLYRDYRDRGLPQGIPLIVLSASTGEKGSFIFKKSVHGGKCPYEPMITVAKQDCVKATKYDTKGEKGLMAWLKHFLKARQPD